MPKFVLLPLFVLGFAHVSGQTAFSKQDTLRGTITPERSWWDVLRYDINITPDMDARRLRGSNLITFRVVKEPSQMQIDLQMGMKLDSALFLGKHLSFQREGNVFFLEKAEGLSIGDQAAIALHFSGVPRKAFNPPWDGGWIWKTDKIGRPWVSAANQGLGASAWYPCKDHQSDEPNNGASISIAVPKGLTAVANGSLAKVESTMDGLSTFTWEINNPINSYNIIPYIGHYAHWGDTLAGEKGALSLDYWVLDYNLEQAKKQFAQVAPMLECFENWLGPYPFYEDGYKLIEVPHLGMEHQSGIAYGNGFENGYKGRDLSASGWGLKWDFIIVHESGHEWFGNSITSSDIADMWIHESFTAYTEAIYTQCLFGVEAGQDYVIGTRQNVMNDKPIIGPYGVNARGSGDMYYKGANMLHTIRHVMNDDSLFKAILRGLGERFYHSIVKTQDIEAYVSDISGHDFSKVFDQYLRTTEIPLLELEKRVFGYRMRWANAVEGFDMPIQTIEGDWLFPENRWKRIPKRIGLPEIDRNFYVGTRIL